MPEASELPGSGAGQFDNPRAVGGNQDTGHVYVGEYGNARISEYTAWGLFVKSWGWGVANGASELQTCGPAEPETNPSPGLCGAGLAGSGKGQLAEPSGGIAVDPAGDVWVGDLEANRRIQKFNSDGEFLLMLGGEVNKTKVKEREEQEANAEPVTVTAQEEDLCTETSGDECGKGSSGSAPRRLSTTLGNVIAYSPTADTIVVGDKDRIQEFELDGTFKSQIPFEGPLAAFDAKSVTGLDVDLSGHIYLVLSSTPDVYKLSTTGEPLEPGKPNESQFKVKDPTFAAVIDDEGNVYAINDPFGEGGAGNIDESTVIEYDAEATKLVPSKGEEEAKRFFPGIPFHGPTLTGLATNICAGSESPGNLYLAAFTLAIAAYVEAYGTGPSGCEDPPKRVPEITAQYATSVGADGATVGAQINPRFWTDATYSVQYGTGKCSEGGCDQEKPLVPQLLTDKSINRAVTTSGVFLGGLEPGTSYHYRFVTQSSGSEGEQVVGVGGEVGNEGEESSFRTFALPTAPPECPNDEFRSGPAAKLPDCRGYEMVSPLDKDNSDALAPNLKFRALSQSATSGERFTYSALRAFAEPQSAPYLSQYLANRTPEDWSSEAISPPHSLPPLDLLGDGFLNEFRGFSADLCSAWLRHNSASTLAPEAIPSYPNLYRRDNCSDSPSYEALTTAEPPNRTPKEYYELTPQGFSADGTHSIFTVDDKLTADAPALAKEELRLYEHTPAGLRYVCILPSGSPSPQACSAGTAAGLQGGTQASLHNAISADGSTIFWTAYSGITAGKLLTGHVGTIYARIDGSETVKVSGSIAPDPAFFWTAADDGSRAFFSFDEGSRKGELYEFDLASKASTLIAKGMEGFLGASEDASRIYLVSTEALAPGGTKGAHNLYLYEAAEGGGGGSLTFVMELTARDANSARLPSNRSGTASPDGLHLTLASPINPTPTGYDNLDAISGQPDAEVYRYDAEAEDLRCVSCNPSGARPVGQNQGGNPPFWAAAQIQGWEYALRTPRVLSEDGSRVFFESHEALVLRDTNNAWDVYQWEEPGSGDCDSGDASFGADSGGCVELISSGESPKDSKFLDADPSGDNVFIGTLSSLIPADYGLSDVYDARVGGGFREPVVDKPCEGEVCQSPPPPPPELTPSSESVQGPGNPPPGAKPKPCKRGTHRVRRNGKARCVKKAKRKGERRASKGRRAAR